MSNGDVGWYLVRTRALSEYIAARSLERSGYEHYLPLVQTPRPRVGRNDAPYFPGYLFVRCDMNGASLDGIHSLPGIHDWVKFEGTTPRVPDRVMIEMRRRIDGINRGGGHWRRYRPGDAVNVLVGATVLEGQVLEETESPKSRVRVLLDFMGELVSTQTPWQQLRPLQHDSEMRASPRRTRGKGRWIRGFGPDSSNTSVFPT